MRVDTETFSAHNVALSKEPRFVIEIAFDEANTILWYFTSHADAALPGGGGLVPSVIQALSGTSQTLNPDEANSNIGTINFTFTDKDGIVTSTLGDQLALGRSTRLQRVRVFIGYKGDAWADYVLIETQLVWEIAYDRGAYTITCQDIQREMRKDIFEQATNTLFAPVLEADTEVQVSFDTAGFELTPHGTGYTDAPSATVGYIRIENEIIRYTGKTGTSAPWKFTDCTRGALNTRAVDHTVDTTQSAERRLKVAEYVLIEGPAISVM